MDRPKCRDCGKPLKDAKFERCFECNKKRKTGGGLPAPRAGLPQSYLDNGYFNDLGYLRDELIVDQATQVASAFTDHQVTTGQIRRFYAHLRQAVRRLDTGESFEAVKPAVLEMKPLAADACGRAKNEGKDFGVLLTFIEANVSQAARAQKNLQQGFLPHFQYVVAYFKYFNPKDGKG